MFAGLHLRGYDTVDKPETWAVRGLVFAGHMLAWLTTPKNRPNAHLQQNANTNTWTENYRRSHAYRCIIVTVLLSQVEGWHLTSQQCPAALPADLQFITGSYLSHSLSLFIHYSALHSSSSQNEVTHCPPVEDICNMTNSPVGPCRSFS